MITHLDDGPHGQRDLAAMAADNLERAERAEGFVERYREWVRATTRLMVAATARAEALERNLAIARTAMVRWRREAHEARAEAKQARDEMLDIGGNLFDLRAELINAKNDLREEERAHLSVECNTRRLLDEQIALVEAHAAALRSANEGRQKAEALVAAFPLNSTRITLTPEQMRGLSVTASTDRPLQFSALKRAPCPCGPCATARIAGVGPLNAVGKVVHVTSTSTPADLVPGFADPDAGHLGTSLTDSRNWQQRQAGR